MRRALRSSDQIPVAVIGIFILAILAAGLFGARAGRPAREISAPEQLHQAMQELRQSPIYNLVIEESSPGYYLLFQGRVEGPTQVIGFLEDYGLEVMLQDNNLYARSRGEEAWQRAEELRLESLGSFLLNPSEVLRLQSPYFSRAFTGEEVLLDGTPCRTVYLHAREEPFIKLLFPSIPFPSIREVLLAAALAEGKLKRLILLVQLEGAEENRIKRTYYIHRD